MFDDSSLEIFDLLKKTNVFLQVFKRIYLINNVEDIIVSRGLKVVILNISIIPAV